MTLISPFMRSFVGVPTSHPIRNKAMIRGTLRKGFNVIKTRSHPLIENRLKSNIPTIDNQPINSTLCASTRTGFIPSKDADQDGSLNSVLLVLVSGNEPFHETKG